MLRHFKALFVFVALIACCQVLSSLAYGQSNQPLEPYVVVGVDCNAEERAKSLLDHAAITAGADKTLIIIARLGSGERSRELNGRRLFAPRNYLVEDRGVAKSRVITAEGERVRGRGHVEVYVGGRLFIIFKMKRHRDFGQGPLCTIIFD